MKSEQCRRKWFRSVAALMTICTATWPLSVRSGEPLQDQEHWKQAFLDGSTAPYFVLVTIVDDRTGQSKTGCTEANFVEGAIHFELDLPYDQAGIDRGQQIALSNTDHVFHFSKQRALDNVAFRYTQEELTQARELVRRYGVHSLMTMPDAEGRKVLGQLEWSDAFACALIEQGVAARMADITGQIVPEP